MQQFPQRLEAEKDQTISLSTAKRNGLTVTQLKNSRSWENNLSLILQSQGEKLNNYLHIFTFHEPLGATHKEKQGIAVAVKSLGKTALGKVGQCKCVDLYGDV